MKLLEEDLGKKFHNIGFGNDFLDRLPKLQTKKGKTRHLILIKLILFFIKGYYQVKT